MLTTVSVHTTPIEAHIVRGRLEAESIPATVAFEHHVWMDWTVSFALGQVRVQVPTAYANHSLAVLADIRAGHYQACLQEQQQGPYALICPRCGCFDTVPSTWPRKLALLLLFVFSLPIPYTSHHWRCPACGHRWIACDSRPYPLFAYVASGATAVAALLMIHGFLDYMCSVRFWVRTCY